MILRTLDNLCAAYYRWRARHIAVDATTRHGVKLTTATMDVNEDGYRVKATFSSSEITRALTDEAAAILAAANAPNYVELTFVSPATYQAHRLIVQNLMGETPAEQNTRLRAEIAALQARISAPEAQGQ
jgi:hypothetical protein